MKITEIDLYKYFGVKREHASGGFITAYEHKINVNLKPKSRPAVLVIPGGAYEFLSVREGEPVALRFFSEGYCPFLLSYSVQTAFPTPLIEACMAMAYIRKNAESLCVDKEHIAVVGFSAGGHLAGMLATMFDDKAVKEIIGGITDNYRPDAAVLSYPVVTMCDGLTHECTRSFISGNGAVEYDRLSLEKRVKTNSVPAFIWHTMEDDCVPVENSMLLATAYRNAGVQFSLHIFEKGWHGLSVCNAETSDMTKQDIALSHVGKWVELALDWLCSRGFAVKTA